MNAQLANRLEMTGLAIMVFACMFAVWHARESRPVESNGLAQSAQDATGNDGRETARQPADLAGRDFDTALLKYLVADRDELRSKLAISEKDRALSRMLLTQTRTELDHAEKQIAWWECTNARLPVEPTPAVEVPSE